MLELPGYQIEREIAKGGMATVYLATHLALQRKVAIKVMAKHLAEQEGFTERFMREARILAGLSHPNIVTIYDVNVHDGVPFISMEYLTGGVTLDQKIKQTIAAKEGLETIKLVAGALGFAHRKGVIHRDVKPNNIMFREDGTAVLADFGIARAIGVARTTNSETRMTATGMIVGTPHYMSPEQVQGHDVAPSSDIYSLGVVLYEILTGKVPYDADSGMAIAIKHVTESVPVLPPALIAFQPAVNRMMAKKVEDRYQSCGDLVRDLNALIANIDGDETRVFAPTPPLMPTPPLPTPSPGEDKARSWPLVAGIAAGVISLAAIGGYYYFGSQAPAPPQKAAGSSPSQDADQTAVQETAAVPPVPGQPSDADRAAAEEESARQQAEQAREQLAALDREPEAQARAERLKSEQERSQRALKQKIDGRLAAGEGQLLNSQLKAAYDNFQAVLQLDPNNRNAADGIQRVAGSYLTLANTAARNNDFDKANQHISSAISIAPTHPKLAETQTKVFELKNAQAARQVAKPPAEATQTTANPPPATQPEKKPRSFGGF